MANATKHKLTYSRSVVMLMIKGFIFLVIIFIFTVGQNLFYQTTLFYFRGNILLWGIYAFIFYFVLKVYDGLHIGAISFTELILSWVLSLFITNIIAFLQISLQQLQIINPLGFIAIFVVQCLLVFPLLFGGTRIHTWLYPAQEILLICGNEEKSERFIEKLQLLDRRYQLKTIITQHESREFLFDCIDRHEAVFLHDVDPSLIDMVTSRCYKKSKRVYIVPSISNIVIKYSDVNWLFDSPLFLLRNGGPSLENLIIKRMIDIFISLLFIIISSPVLLILSILIRLYDGHPAFYKQTRLTRNDKTFTLYKLRSMTPDAEKDGIARLSSKNDSRITPIGAFIRKTRLDELPQFWNIFIGDMSIVGPRPERPEIAELYKEAYPSFVLRTKVKAGLTGYAQIYGKYNTSPDEKLLLDLIYIERQSLLMDFELIMKTAKIVLLPSSTEGIEDNSVTAMKEPVVSK